MHTTQLGEPNYDRKANTLFSQRNEKTRLGLNGRILLSMRANTGKLSRRLTHTLSCQLPHPDEHENIPDEASLLW